MKTRTIITKDLIRDDYSDAESGDVFDGAVGGLHLLSHVGNDNYLLIGIDSGLPFSVPPLSRRLMRSMLLDLQWKKVQSFRISYGL